jgi:hypothetical protein
MRWPRDTRPAVVVLSILAVFLAGAFNSPLWLPRIVAPVSAGGYAPVARQGFGWSDMTPVRYLALVIGELVELYLAFGLGWLIAWLLG